LLVARAVDIPHPSAAIDDECGRARNVNGVAAEGVMDAVVSGRGAIFIEQEHAFDRMLRQEAFRLPDAIALFGGDEYQLRPRGFYFWHARLELSHAFSAIRSPGAAHKFENQLALGEQTVESERALAVGRSQRKIRGERADFQSFRATFHADFEC